MSEIKEYLVEPCERKEIKDFIEEWHYSKNINGLICDYCFKLTHKGKLIGGMIYGRIAMAGVWKKYAKEEKQLTELRRLCCIDKTPQNTESFFIGATMRWLQKNTEIIRVLSYADKTFGHQGIIYQASNFKLVGETSPGRTIMYNGKRYHDKTIRTKYKGELKPFAKKIKDALETGEAKYTKTLPKNIYIYDFKPKKMRATQTQPKKSEAKDGL